MTWVFITTTSYLTESFKETPATLVALASLFRNPAAAVSAVVVKPLTDKMGIGWCFTGLALMEFICVGLIYYLMVYGKGMREKYERTKAAGRPKGPPNGVGPPNGKGPPTGVGPLDGKGPLNGVVPPDSKGPPNGKGP